MHDRSSRPRAPSWQARIARGIALTALVGGIALARAQDAPRDCPPVAVAPAAERLPALLAARGYRVERLLGPP